VIDHIYVGCEEYIEDYLEEKGIELSEEAFAQLHRMVAEHIYINLSEWIDDLLTFLEEEVRA